MRPVLALIALSTALGAQIATAQSVPCGEPYIIQRGDTLQRIARRAYGPDATYHGLWRANRDAIGLSDPSLIEVGQVILVPCLNAGDAAAAPDAAAIPPSDATAMQDAGLETADTSPLPAAEAANVSTQEKREPDAAQKAAEQVSPMQSPDGAQAALAPTDANATPIPAPLSSPLATPRVEPQPHLQPLPDPRLVAQRIGEPGLADAVIAAALTQTVGATGWRIVPADNGTWTDALRFPMARPDCGQQPALSAEARALCDTLAWSAPLIQDVVVARSRQGAGALTGFAGLRVCRAKGAPAPDLSMAQAVVAAPDAASCLRATAAGEADVALSLSGAGDAALAQTGLGAALVEQGALARLVTLRAAAPINDPAGRAALAALDLGLTRLLRDGALFAVIEAALKP